MTLEEILRHPKVENIDLRYTPEDGFTIYPFIYGPEGFSTGKRPVSRPTLQKVIDALGNKIESLFGKG
jgi:hypothetical protein